jgi:very-short-patch-repair endonuclease
MDGRSVARVDFVCPGGLIVEVAGHATHATRRQRQVDAQRTTELTLKGGRVLTFTYDDVHHRPSWVVAQLRRALSLAA